jgi:CDP-paratose 2-epimerase
VRDVLFIEDLLDAYDAAFRHLDQSAGQVFNIGGGRENSISVWAEFGPQLENLIGKSVKTKNREWRPGDQPVFISDIGKASQLLNWTPKVNLEQGIRRLYDWVKENQNLFS